MIVINSGQMHIPEDERFIGFVGDNLHSTRQFLLTNVSEQNCIYRLYLTFDDGTTNYFVLDNLVENGSTLLTWTVLEEHIFKSGVVNAQIKCFASDCEVYHTTTDYFIVADSQEYADSFKQKDNAEFLRYERQLNSILTSIKSGSSNFVQASRTIAGLDLVDNITVAELQQALNMYPILNTMYEPTTSTKGIVGQLCVGGLWEGEYKLYICINVKDGIYTWEQIGASITNSTDCVLKTAKIAGVDLEDDVTAEELQEALNTYPVLTSSSLSNIEENIKVGQLALLMTYDGTKFSQDIYYRYSGGLYLVGGTNFNNKQLDGYVPTTRKIADIDLAEDISAGDLNEALGILSESEENIFDYSSDNLLVGYNTTSASISEMLDTLELSVDDTVNVRVAESYTLYKKIIPVLQGEEYALSESFRGMIRLYDANGNNLSVVSVTNNNPLPTGENCSVLAIPEEVSYINLNFMNSANVDYSEFMFLQGTKISNAIKLNSDIKVSYNQLIDVPENNYADQEYVDEQIAQLTQLVGSLTTRVNELSGV